MRNLFVFLMLLIGLLTGVVYAYDNDKFIEKFSNCTVYSTTDYSGQKQIKGWRAGKCIYVEKDNYGQKTQCVLNDEQLADLSEVMRIYSHSNSTITIKYTNGTQEKFNTGSATIWNWTQYLNMYGVCSPTR